MADDVRAVLDGGFPPDPPGLPACGAFAWRLRAVAPGLDGVRHPETSAVAAAAKAAGYAVAGHRNDMAGRLAAYMALAFATLYDKAVTVRAGLRAWDADKDFDEVAGLAAAGYAACRRMEELRPAGYDPDEFTAGTPTTRVIPYHTAGGGDDGPHPRVEMGAVQFGDDWPGLFLRGDDAFCLMLNLKAVLAGKAGAGSMEYRQLAAVVDTIAADVLVNGVPQPVAPPAPVITPGVQVIEGSP